MSGWESRSLFHNSDHEQAQATNSHGDDDDDAPQQPLSDTSLDVNNLQALKEWFKDCYQYTEDVTVPNIFGNKYFQEIYNVHAVVDFEYQKAEWRDDVKKRKYKEKNMTLSILLRVLYAIEKMNESFLNDSEKLFKTRLEALKDSTPVKNLNERNRLEVERKKSIWVQYVLNPHVEELRFWLRIIAALTGLGIHAIFSYTTLDVRIIASLVAFVDLVSLFAQWFTLHNSNIQLKDGLLQWLGTFKGLKNDNYAGLKFFLPNILSMLYNVVLGSGVIPGFDESTLYNLRWAAVASSYLIRLWNHEVKES
jgi:hypothetical protein